MIHHLYAFQWSFQLQSRRVNLPHKKIVEGMDASIWKRSWPALPMTPRIKRMRELCNYFRTQRWDTLCSGRMETCPELSLIEHPTWWRRIDVSCFEKLAVVLYNWVESGEASCVWNLYQVHCFAVSEICNHVPLWQYGLYESRNTGFDQ